jgi:hypothetical protein
VARVTDPTTLRTRNGARRRQIKGTVVSSTITAAAGKERPQGQPSTMSSRNRLKSSTAQTASARARIAEERRQSLPAPLEARAPALHQPRVIPPHSEVIIIGDEPAPPEGGCRISSRRPTLSRARYLKLVPVQLASQRGQR